MSRGANKSNREPILSTGGEAPMTAEQAKLLKQLALDAYEPDAYSANLTHGDAERRIATLQAKLKLLDAPPHTL
jgi:hypothetical protein